ncbi:MAG: NRDE family protein, partial [Kordia sp.]|uniref:NRDE family protein n=1 Tax=Kordia sp. TaxID=1965332 RepID=UPI00385FF1C6
MCTVSFIYKGNDEFVLTSSRDESPMRETKKPALYSVSDTKLVFPKDAISGGTWIGMSAQKRVVCLLNGGFEKHRRLLRYRHSRGIVVHDFLTAKNIKETIANYNLHLIEPFTVIIVDWNNTLEVLEFVWDGAQKQLKSLSLQTPHIWSSSMLYTDEMKQLRIDWFKTFQQKEELHATSLLQFHKTAGNGDANVAVMMDRFVVKTISITQIEKTTDTLSMYYHDLLKDEE